MCNLLEYFHIPTNQENLFLKLPPAPFLQKSAVKLQVMLTFKRSFKKVLFSTFSIAIKGRTNNLKVVYQNLTNKQVNMGWISHRKWKNWLKFYKNIEFVLFDEYL